MNAKMSSALNSYSSYGTNSEIEYADPHRLIQLLFDGALKRLAMAKGAMQRKQVEEKGRVIGRVIDIVGGLQAGLDLEKGGEIAANLDSLYDYINRQLVVANRENDEAILDEVSGLLRSINTAWAVIDSVGDVAETEGDQSVSQSVSQAEVVASKVVADVAEQPVTVKPVEKPVTKPVNARANRALKAYSV